MYTTNTASKGLATTYANRREECEDLLNIAKKIEAITARGGSFSDDPIFESLEQDFRGKLLSLLSLSL
jgi:hypothetical protein